MFGNDMLRVKQRSGGRFAPSYFVAGLKPCASTEERKASRRDDVRLSLRLSTP
jgi:hypothetical protein